MGLAVPTLFLEGVWVPPCVVGRVYQTMARAHSCATCFDTACGDAVYTLISMFWGVML